VLRATGDEGFVWAAAVRSDGALAVRVHFTDFSIPSDAEAYVFGVGGEAHGPYLGRGPNGTGDFWSHSIHADTAIVLVRYFGPGGAEGISGMSLRISDVGHVGADFPAFWTDNNTAAFCAYNEPCIENASGHNAPGAAEDAVALMRYISGAFIYICSGGLLADTDAGSDIPYFLTANHCISKNNEAANLETYFQYQASSPSGCLDDPFFDSFPSGLSTLGSSIVAKNRTSDYTLLQLSEQPPSGSAFLGWDASTDVANSNGTSLYRISHPAGAPQSYSEHTVDTSAPTCGSWPRGNWIYSRDDVGGTEGGSSGSPVVNGAGQVVGQLSGGCGTNVNDPCDDENNATVDGAFFAYYDQVAPYLDPGTSCTPSAEVCDDGIDNDCDSAVDCDDSDCTGDPACDTGGCINPDGAPVGDPCNSDADCCGDKCKGRPGAKTCK
jgi:hypothetical protein